MTHYCPLCGTPTPTGVCPVHGVAGMQPGGADPGRVFAPGMVIGGRYRIEQVLAIQPPQATLLASRTEGGGPVVIHALGVERLARRARLLDGLFREAEVVRLFQRPGLAQIVDFGVEPVSQNPFLVTDLAPGRTPADALHPTGLEQTTARSFVEVCLGLLDTHDAELLAPADAMPTQVPMSPSPPVARARPRLGPGGAAPRPARAGPKTKKGKKGKRPPKKGIIGRVPGWALMLGGLFTAMLVYALVPDPEHRYYRPDVTQVTNVRWIHGAPEMDPGGYGGAGQVREGSIEIATLPIGAQVWMDSQVVGETPMGIPRPEGGDRVQVVLRLEGYLDKQVTLHRDSAETMSVRLLPLNGKGPTGLFGDRDPDKGDPLSADPFKRFPSEEKPLGRNPLVDPVFINPFGEPGTAPAVPPPASASPYDDE